MTALFTAFQREHLLAAAHAVDELIGDLARDVADYPVGSFNEDMSAALSGDPRVPFTVKDVLDAMHNWSVMAVNRWSHRLS